MQIRIEASEVEFFKGFAWGFVTAALMLVLFAVVAW